MLLHEDLDFCGVVCWQSLSLSDLTDDIGEPGFFKASWSESIDSTVESTLPGLWHNT